MGVSLEKGANVNLTKAAAEVGLAALTVGLGWDARATDGAQFDLDAVVFLVKADGKVRNDKDFIFFNNKTDIDGSVVHQGDNLTGQGDGDDEQVKIDVTKVPADVEQIFFAVTIHQAAERKQNFGQVSNAFIRVVNDADKTEMAKFDLGEDAAVETAMTFGALYRNNGDWKFKAIGQGFAGGLKELALSYGVNV